jgi:anti-sigma B factor antagonist
MLSIRDHLTSDGARVCTPVGELDAFTVHLFRQALAGQSGSGRLLIDLTSVTFIDSAGLGALVGGIRRTRERGAEVAVACGRPQLLRLLHRVGLDLVVLVADTLDDAASGLEEHPPTVHAQSRLAS